MSVPIFSDVLSARRAGGDDAKPLLAAWMTLGSPVSVEIAAKDGWDLVLIDQQHGVPGGQTLMAMATAARAAGLPAFVRVGENAPGLIGRALDMGAAGVVCPMVNSRELAERLVHACKFPPLGGRSYGPLRGGLVYDAKEAPDLDRVSHVCAQIETREALDNLDEILGVKGLDMICVGPNDLTLSMTNGESRDVWAPERDGTLQAILTACRDKAVAAWIFANTPEYAQMCVEMGWDIISIGTDAGWLSVGAASAMKAAHGSPDKS